MEAEHEASTSAPAVVHEARPASGVRAPPLVPCPRPNPAHYSANAPFAIKALLLAGRSRKHTFAYCKPRRHHRSGNRFCAFAWLLSIEQRRYPRLPGTLLCPTGTVPTDIFCRTLTRVISLSDHLAVPVRLVSCSFRHVCTRRPAQAAGPSSSIGKSR